MSGNEITVCAEPQSVLTLSKKGNGFNAQPVAHGIRLAVGKCSHILEADQSQKLGRPRLKERASFTRNKNRDGVRQCQERIYVQMILMMMREKDSINPPELTAYQRLLLKPIFPGK